MCIRDRSWNVWRACCSRAGSLAMLHASRRIWGYPLRTRVRRGGASSRRSGCGARARTRASSFGWP
eukprot:7789448-Alexandrium_andersonii.AAC.1